MPRHFTSCREVLSTKKKKPSGVGAASELKAQTSDRAVEALHRRQTKKLKQELGNVPLSDVTLRKKCKQLFRAKFLGIRMQDQTFPSGKSGYGIMNTDHTGGSGIHWVAVVKTGNSTHVYDSFGRHAKNVVPTFTKSIIGRGRVVRSADPSDADQHGYTSVDCGHRCLSALMIANSHGVNEFLKL
jgi:ribosomal protein L16/L10AE